MRDLCGGALTRVPMSEALIQYADVVAARERIDGHTHVTPVQTLEDLGLLVKTENTQGTGSFKLRGATNAVRPLSSRSF